MRESSRRIDGVTGRSAAGRKRRPDAVKCRPQVESLERLELMSVGVVGSLPGQPGVVKLIDEATGAALAKFRPFGRFYRGGINAILGDVNHDGTPDLIVSQETGRGTIRVFNGKTKRLIRQVQPFGARYHGGTTLAYDPLRSARGGGAVLVESRSGKPLAAVFDGRTLRRTALLESPTQRPVLQKYTGIVYNPTWPNWSSFQSQGNIASASGTSGTVTVTVQGNPNWVTDVFGHSGDPNPKLNFSESVLFCPVVGGQPNFGNNVILPILGNTSNTLQVDASQTNLPANFTYYVILTNQLTPSDFATQAFQGLWGTVPGQGNQGRNDLAAFQSAGYNLIRLFNWDPTLGTTVTNPQTPSDLQAHTAFLDAAYSGGSQVMVPVSNYSLSNAQFGWVYLPGEAPPGKSTGQIADPSTSFAFNDPNVPSHIRTSLMQFIQSVTQPATDPNNPTGQARINPAVQSISVGNEIDLGLNVGTPGGGGLPNATEKLLRAEWWMINLRQ
jgi:hypothetical protein